MSQVFLARYTWTVWTLTRKRTQWRSVTSTVRYHLPRSRLLSVHRSGALTSMQVTDSGERRVVNCPNHKASQYLAAFVAEHQIGDGTVHIALRRVLVQSRGCSPARRLEFRQDEQAIKPGRALQRAPFPRRGHRRLCALVPQVQALLARYLAPSGRAGDQRRSLDHSSLGSPVRAGI